MRQAQDFLAESEALHGLVSSLSDHDLDEPTAFKDWTINDVLGHLHVWNHAADLALTDTGSFRAFFAGVEARTSAGGTLRDFERDWLDGLCGKALVESWRTFYGEMTQRFATADPSQRVAWAGPDMSVRSSITARLMETWAHGQEVHDVLGVERVNTDRIRNIVVLGVNTYGWTFHVRGQEPPVPPPYLQLQAPSGQTWTYNEQSENERIEGLAEEFCQVVTQVRNVADTDLRVVGANATEWMSKAQCFAGAAENPPAPGSRQTDTSRRRGAAG